MNSIKTLVSYLLFFVVCFNLYNCTTAEDEYVNSLPDNSIGIVKINVGEIFEKGDFSKHQAFVGQFTNAITSDLQGEEKTLAEKIIKDPEASGISINSPLYIFAQSEILAQGLLAKVKNASDLNKLMTLIVNTVQQEPVDVQGVKIYRLSSQLVVAHNEKRLLVLINDISNEYIIELINKNSIKQLSAKPGMNQFMKEKSDFVVWQSTAEMSHLFNNFISKFNVNQIRYGSLSTNMLMTLNFEKGKIAINSTTYPSSTEDAAKYDKLMNLVKPLNGKLLSKLPEKSIMNAGVNLEYLYNTDDNYNETQQLKELLYYFRNTGFKVDSIGYMFNGDLIVDIEAINNIGFPQFSVLAEVPNNLLLENIVSVSSKFNLKLDKTPQGVYSYQNLLYMQSKDGLFAITTNKAVLDNLSKGISPSLADASYAGIYKNSYGAMYLDFKSILNNKIIGAKNNPSFKYYKSITDITMTCPEKNIMKMNINFEKKDVNALQQILY